MKGTEEDSSLEKAYHCVLQHFKIFRKQALRGEIADFGEPCVKCSRIETCNPSAWFSILSPMLDKSDVEISMWKERDERDRNKSDI